jgi:hypothetical protein
MRTISRMLLICVTMNFRSHAWRNGHMAYHTGKDHRHNPYDCDTQLLSHGAWTRGLNDARWFASEKPLR